MLVVFFKTPRGGPRRFSSHPHSYLVHQNLFAAIGSLKFKPQVDLTSMNRLLAPDASDLAKGVVGGEKKGVALAPDSAS